MVRRQRTHRLEQKHTLQSPQHHPSQNQHRCQGKTLLIEQPLLASLRRAGYERRSSAKPLWRAEILVKVKQALY